MSTYPSVRLRRYRETYSLRDMFGLRFPSPSKFIWPVFIIEGKNVIKPISSLPSQYYYSIDVLTKNLEPVISSGVGGVLLFGMIEDSQKSLEGAYAFSDDGLVQQAIRELRHNFPELSIFVDTGLSGYTKHGHNGIFNDKNQIDNDITLKIFRKIAISQAAAGATCVAPSGMVDGQVKAIREELDQSGFSDILIMSYSTKFDSNLYDTFPYAIQKPRKHDTCTRTYLTPPNDSRQAIREAKLDVEEAADIVMVKPATFYLDIISQLRKAVDVPIAAYNVSGEYSMIHAAANVQWGELYPLAREALLAIYRAGADIIISYWANQYNEISKETF